MWISRKTVVKPLWQLGLYKGKDAYNYGYEAVQNESNEYLLSNILVPIRVIVVERPIEVVQDGFGLVLIQISINKQNQ